MLQRALAPLVPFALLCGLHSQAPAAPSDAAESILPHRATYSYAIEREKSDPGYLDAAGEMVTLWSDDCDGWTVEQTSRLLIERTGGVIIDFGWSMESWESKDGLQFRYFLAQAQDGNVISRVQGRATLDAIGEGGEVEIRGDGESITVELLPGTIFPTWHSLDVIDSLQQDRLPLWHVLFDGADDENVLSGVSTFHIGERMPTEDELERFPDLAGQSLHRMAFAFFPMQQEASEPEHEMELSLAVNGVVTEFVFDFGEFAVRASLEKLEPMPSAAC